MMLLDTAFNKDFTSHSKRPILNIGLIKEGGSFNVLGLTEKSFLKNLKGIQYKDGNTIKKFLRKDYGGCSKGFNKFYSMYMNEGILEQLKVGGASSLIIDANEAYKCDLEVLKTRPLYLLCDDPLCLSCRATWKNNKKDIIPFFINLFLKKFFKYL